MTFKWDADVRKNTDDRNVLNIINTNYEDSKNKQTQRPAIK